MLWTDVALKVDGADVVDLRPAGLPVDRALVQLAVPPSRRVDCIDVDHRHRLIEHLGVSKKTITKVLKIAKVSPTNLRSCLH